METWSYFVSLKAFLRENSKVHPMLDGKVAHATTFPHMYILHIDVYKCIVICYSSSCAPTSWISTMEFVTSGSSSIHCTSHTLNETVVSYQPDYT